MFHTVNNETIEIRSITDLEALPASAIVSIYNDMTGKSIKKFSDKATAVARTWAEIGDLDFTPEETPQPTKTITGRKNQSKVRVLVEGNPFREGSLVWNRWNNAQPKDGDTIEDLGRRGLTGGDINWCIKKNHSLEIIEDED